MPSLTNDCVTAAQFEHISTNTTLFKPKKLYPIRQYIDHTLSVVGMAGGIVDHQGDQGEQTVVPFAALLGIGHYTYEYTLLFNQEQLEIPRRLGPITPNTNILPCTGL